MYRDILIRLIKLVKVLFVNIVLFPNGRIGDVSKDSGERKVRAHQGLAQWTQSVGKYDACCAEGMRKAWEGLDWRVAWRRHQAHHTKAFLRI